MLRFVRGLNEQIETEKQLRARAPVCHQRAFGRAGTGGLSVNDLDTEKLLRLEPDAEGEQNGDRE